jgi:predicted metalloprotease with PDZ domain
MGKFLFFLSTMAVMINAQPSLQYIVSMPQPWNHLFQIEIRVTGITSDHLLLHMPAWRTGRYVILDFAGEVRNFSSADENLRSREFKKIDNETWQIETSNCHTIVATYAVYANEFNMRTRELTGDHAFFDPAALFMYTEELKNSPIEITVHPYSNWHITTGLDEVNGKKQTYATANYEQLIDSPFEIGTQKDFEFSAEGVQHVISIYGDGDWNADTLINDFSKIISEDKKFWGDLPYKKYIFFIHCQPNAGGGTEHINSTVMGTRPFVFSKKESYRRFLGLVSHEYFHTWNVKQLRPKAYSPYDLSKEGYSEELWISEGMTSYFDELILLYAGMSTPESYVDQIPKMIEDDRSRPGNTVQPLSESSYDAWIKFWKGLQDSYNAQSDYYGKGSHLSLLLDLEIRQRSDDKHSLHSVLKAMYQNFPLSKGFANADFIAECEKQSGSSLKEFFDNYLYGTAPLPWEQNLLYAGLEIAPKDSVKKIHLGITTQDVNDRIRITNVLPGSPAEKAALEVNDEILALNGFKIKGSDLGDRISSMNVGDTITLTFFRNEKLRETVVTLEPFGVDSYSIHKIKNPSALQKTIYESWLHARFEVQ